MFDWLTGYDSSNAAAGQAAADKLAAQAAIDYAPGGKSYEAIAAAQGTAAADLAQASVAGDYGNQANVSQWSILGDGLLGTTEFITDPDLAASDIATQSALIGQGIGNGVGTVTGGLFNGLFDGLWSGLVAFVKKIPLWVWLALALAAFLYFGGWKLLRGKVAAKLA